MGIFSTTELNSMEDLLVNQLEDLYDAEKRLTDALPKMAEAVSSGQCKSDGLDFLCNRYPRIVRPRLIACGGVGSPAAPPIYCGSSVSRFTPMPGKSRQIAPSTACQQHNQHDDQKQREAAARIIAPRPAVRPHRQ